MKEDLPENWVEAAIQYKVLKKCIARVVKELEFLGLSKTDLKVLMQDDNEDKTVELNDDETLPSNPIVAKYSFTKPLDSKQIVPYLKITVDRDSHDMSNPDHLHELAREIRGKIESVLSDEDDDHHIVEIKEHEDQLVLSPTTSKRNEELVTVKDTEIIIMLKSDSRFFRMLDSELESLDRLREQEETYLINAIEQVGKVVVLATNKKSDLYKWRELFRLYIESEVFFRYNDTSMKQLERSAEQIRNNLNDFVNHVNDTQIVAHLGKKRSAEAYGQFVEINKRLLKMLEFQSINSTALRKILKKFDKQTALNVSGRYPAMVSQDHVFMTGASIAQTICSILQTKLLGVVPQLDDYLCPICVSVAYKPIRLVCGHLFCVRCLVKMKQRGKTDCPLCRHPEAIAYADSSNLDIETMALIKKSFPVEVREKLKELEQERYRQVVGDRKACVIV